MRFKYKATLISTDTANLHMITIGKDNYFFHTDDNQLDQDNNAFLTLVNTKNEICFTAVLISQKLITRANEQQKVEQFIKRSNELQTSFGIDKDESTLLKLNNQTNKNGKVMLLYPGEMLEAVKRAVSSFLTAEPTTPAIDPESDGSVSPSGSPTRTGMFKPSPQRHGGFLNTDVLEKYARASSQLNNKNPCI